MAKEKRKFGIRDKLAYAAGDAGCNLSFGLKNTVQTFWLVFMMMETGLFSILLLLVQIWDAINDPLIGSIIDNDGRKYRHGKYKTYIFIGALGLLVGGAAVFLPFPNADTVVKAIMFILGYVIWDAAYTVANVPYGTMLNLVTEDDQERASLSVFRSIGGMIGGLVPGIILPMLIWNKIYWTGDVNDFWDKIAPSLTETNLTPEDFTHYPNNTEIFGNNAGLPYKIGDKVYSPLTGVQLEYLLGDRVFWAALIMGVIAFVFFMFMLKNITIRGNEYSQLERGQQNIQKAKKVNIFKSFGTFMKNRPAVGCTIAAMGMFLGMQSAGTANTIMFATHFGNASMSGLVTFVGYLPMVIFMPLATKLVRKYGKKEVASIGSLAGLLGAVILLIFPLCPRDWQLVIYMIGLVFFGLGLGFYNCVSWAMMGDAIDYQEWKYGKREESVVYSLHSFFRKLAQGVGPAAVIAIMGTSLIGYDSKLGTIGQSATTASNMCWLVAILYTISAVCQFVGVFLIYNINKNTVTEMHEDLANRE